MEVTKQSGGVLRYISKVLAVLGSGFLIFIMAIMVANIIYRLFFGHVIIGAYDLVLVNVAVVAALSMGYTAIERGHIEVTALASRFRKRAQSIFAIVTSLLGIIFVAILCWATIWLICERAQIGERSDVLGIPYLPYRFIWLFGLVFFLLVLLLDLYRKLRPKDGR